MTDEQAQPPETGSHPKKHSSFLRDIKDRSLAFLLRTYLNHKYKTLGTMTTLHLNTQDHTAEVSLDLEGETEPIRLAIQYHVEENSEGLVLRPVSLECSRPWIQTAGRELIDQGVLSFPIPKGPATALLKTLRVG